MNIAELTTALADRGLVLRADGDALVLEGAEQDAVTPDLAEAIRRNKAALLEAGGVRTTVPASDRVATARYAEERLEGPTAERWARAVALAGMSGQTFLQAEKVVDQGTPELVRAMDGGDISISAAAELAGRPHEVQVAGIVGALLARGITLSVEDGQIVVHGPGPMPLLFDWRLQEGKVAFMDHLRAAGSREQPLADQGHHETATTAVEPENGIPPLATDGLQIDPVVPITDHASWVWEWNHWMGLLAGRLVNTQESDVRDKLLALIAERPRSEADWLALGERIRKTEEGLQWEDMLQPYYWPPGQHEEVADAGEDRPAEMTAAGYRPGSRAGQVRGV